MVNTVTSEVFFLLTLLFCLYDSNINLPFLSLLVQNKIMFNNPIVHWSGSY